ncbi:hypothetical protein CEXT_94601 [Caerostris extrusa]|uniref:Uncharacterized protein n=1 Tax=Caerostris extrusa TaxID=172846 RepID=A0AAV4QTG7_CAEEX|nr:hypothetical protein CEXT_94601 [Caerostris extrusa]
MQQQQEAVSKDKTRRIPEGRLPTLKIYLDLQEVPNEVHQLSWEERKEKKKSTTRNLYKEDATWLSSRSRPKVVLGEVKRQQILLPLGGYFWWASPEQQLDSLRIIGWKKTLYHLSTCGRLSSSVRGFIVFTKRQNTEDVVKACIFCVLLAHAYCAEPRHSRPYSSKIIQSFIKKLS